MERRCASASALNLLAHDICSQVGSAGTREALAMEDQETAALLRHLNAADGVE